MEFNKAQMEAATHNTGPMLVLAGPGSGKTSVLTGRIQYLIEEGFAEASQILVITFTKAAAEEMKERFLSLMAASHTDVTIGTFHAVYFQILKHAYHYGAGNIIKDSNKIQILREIIEKLNIETDNETELIANILSEVSLVKNKRICVQNYASLSVEETVFRTIFCQYEMSLKRNGYLDFDDMLLMCCELFEKRKDILKLWQNKFSYILIDEFQDINQVQYDVIKMLAGMQKNLFVVGDDDQSIYGFRGASPEFILNFKKEFPDAKSILLDYNYRSTQIIIQGAEKVICCNKERYAKHIRTTNEMGMPVVYREFDTRVTQYQEVISLLSEEMYTETAVLFRTNITAGMLAEQLSRNGIPFILKDSLTDIYEHFIAKDIFSYIELAMGKGERSILFKILNKPRRYISRESLKNPIVDFRDIRAYYRDKPYICEAVRKLEYDLIKIGRMNPYAAIHYIVNGMEYNAYLEEYAQRFNRSREELMEVVKELKERARGFLTHEAWFRGIKVYREELKSQRLQKKEKKEGVSLLTMHSAKGLEFTTVFIVDANESITPHKKAALPLEIEEERRLFYVGMTRAKKKLYLFSVKEHHGKILEASRFVKEFMGIPYSSASSNSALSRNSSNASATNSYSSSSSIKKSSGSASSFVSSSS